MTQFRNTLDPDVALDPPHGKSTFQRCVLDDGERRGNGQQIALHRDLIALRPLTAGKVVVGSAFDERRLVLRFGSTGDERLLVVNLGSTFDLARMSDPLVAPPAQNEWKVIWHSERPAYGGAGMPPLERLRWDIPGHSAVLFGTHA
jgi:maltooligosyltrehalose trehalohydrolase